jgi:hypothetical protein
MAGWLARWLAGWLAGRLAGWQVGWLAVGWLVGWLLAGWLADWLAGWLTDGWLAACWLAGMFENVFENECVFCTNGSVFYTNVPAGNATLRSGFKMSPQAGWLVLKTDFKMNVFFVQMGLFFKQMSPQAMRF